MYVLNSSAAFLKTWWVYLLVGIIFFYVLLQSFYFLIKSYKKAKEFGLSKEALNKTIVSSMIFSIAPSIAILLGLVLLTPVFGSMIAGMRLATLGAYTYEIPAATNVIQGVFGLNFGDLLSQEIVVTAIWVMTLGCIPPLLIVPLFLKKMQTKMKVIKEKDKQWNQIMMDALFIGMISAFVGFVVAPRSVDGSDPFISILAILTLLTSAILIIVLGTLIKKYKLEWMKNYALPISMILSMALAILYSGFGVI